MKRPFWWIVSWRIIHKLVMHRLEQNTAGAGYLVGDTGRRYWLGQSAGGLILHFLEMGDHDGAGFLAFGQGAGDFDGLADHGCHILT